MSILVGLKILTQTYISFLKMQKKIFVRLLFFKNYLYFRFPD